MTYRLSAATSTADTLVPSASAFAFAASHTSSGTRMLRSGVPGGISAAQSGTETGCTVVDVPFRQEALGVRCVGLSLTSGETCLEARCPLAALVDLGCPLGFCHAHTVPTPVPTASSVSDKIFSGEAA